MPLYRRKSNPQMLVRYPSKEADKFVERHEDGSTFIWNARSKSKVNIENGDFINITEPSDLYPIKPDFVAKNYEEVE